MKRLSLIGLAIGSALLSACSNPLGLPHYGSASGTFAGRLTPPRSAPPATPGPAKAPNPLLVYNGSFYGTTQFGGQYGGGELFSLAPSGLYKTLYAFKAYGLPLGGLAAVSGTLYGTSAAAGHGGSGRVFGVRAADGKLVFEYDFRGVPDGANPNAGLVDGGNGTLYGTTLNGGAHGNGSIYSIATATGKESVLFSFGAASDGDSPSDRLTLKDGTLYGTTESGGPGCGCGTVFAYDLASGHEKILYAFRDGSDGYQPVGGVTYVNGKLYGSTSLGGNGQNCFGLGCGTVYSVDLSTGTERVLYRFAPPMGDLPYSDLTPYNGKLYGTTLIDGKGVGQGHGTIFSVDPETGTVSIVHRFARLEGSWPQDLVAFGGHLYGNAQQGGSNRRGTIFRFDPPGTVTPIFNF